MSFYSKHIADDLALLGVQANVAHVESNMRNFEGTLDHLSRAQLRLLVAVAAADLQSAEHACAFCYKRKRARKS